ncbi:energy transducer TonB [uncultured Azonexus sp.]|uniref:energy transducer TonB n=1 Tax=uncultured Azonexus sp. TaxID=520307 RepID=UPI00260F095F|nr:energy transducer TonB [uncultured Azonexus sp.]
MSRTLRPLLGALGASLLLHLLPFVDLRTEPTVVKPPEPPPLQARLAPALPAAPEILLPEPEIPPVATAASKQLPPPRKAVEPIRKTWTQAISEQFSAQQREGLFYPEEAIRRGLEGEALVLLMLDENGQVVAARIEESSGHPLLDEAALRAVRRLRSLPADAPIESLLPVRFRLKYKQ